MNTQPSGLCVLPFPFMSAPVAGIVARICAMCGNTTGRHRGLNMDYQTGDDFPLLPHRQPNMMQRDAASRSHFRALSELEFLAHNIKLEVMATRQRRSDPARLAIGVDWIRTARRRQAQLRRQIR